jgi:hypothetical protein
MNTRKAHNLPARLESVRQRFELWRRTHRTRSRIPGSLWAAAARAAGTFGLHRTSRALRLDYYSLKERVEQQSIVAPDPPKRTTADQRFASVPAFLELAPVTNRGFAAAPVDGCECRLEFENAGGAKMRVHLKGAQTPDLAALSRSFWNPAS